MPDHFSLHTGKYIRGFNSLRHTAIRQIKFRVTGIQQILQNKKPRKNCEAFSVGAHGLEPRTLCL